MIKIIKKVALFYRLLSYLPFSWFLLFALFVFRAYITLGRLPSYDRPDPKYLGFDLHHGILFFNLFIVLCSPLLWLPLTIFILVKNKKHISFLDVVCYLFFYIFFLLFLKLDFRGLSVWFVD